MTALLKLYQKSFDNRPFLTLICANATLTAAGDAVAQTVQMVLANHDAQTPLYDSVRTMRFAIFGAAMGPIIGRWAKFLENRFPLYPGITTFAPVAKRVASDQFFMAPLGLVVFLGSMGIMEGRNSAEIKQKYIDLYAPALFANWKVWPLAQVVNFRFMPLSYRVPFQSTCGVFWTLYLSLLNSNENRGIDMQHVMKAHASYVIRVDGESSLVDWSTDIDKEDIDGM